MGRGVAPAGGGGRGPHLREAEGDRPPLLRAAAATEAGRGQRTAEKSRVTPAPGSAVRSLTERHGGAPEGVSAASGLRRSEACAAATTTKVRLSALRRPSSCEGRDVRKARAHGAPRGCGRSAGATLPRRWRPGPRFGGGLAAPGRALRAAQQGRSRMSLRSSGQRPRAVLPDFASLHPGYRPTTQIPP